MGKGWEGRGRFIESRRGFNVVDWLTGQKGLIGRSQRCERGRQGCRATPGERQEEMAGATTK
jgi:hypothetical protein